METPAHSSQVALWVQWVWDSTSHHWPQRSLQVLWKPTHQSARPSDACTPDSKTHQCRCEFDRIGSESIVWPSERHLGRLAEVWNQAVLWEENEKKKTVREYCLFQLGPVRCMLHQCPHEHRIWTGRCTHVLVGDPAVRISNGCVDENCNKDQWSGFKYSAVMTLRGCPHLPRKRIMSISWGGETSCFQ